MANRRDAVDFLVEMQRAVNAMGVYLAEHVDLTQPEALVMAYLAETPRAALADVYNAFLHRRSTLTSVLDRLEGRGFLTRKPLPADRRSIQIELTSAGKREASRVRKVVQDLAETIPFGAARLAQAREVVVGVTDAAVPAV